MTAAGRAAVVSLGQSFVEVTVVGSKQRTRRRMARGHVAAIVALGLVAGACGDSDTGATADSSTTTTSVAASTSSPPTTDSSTTTSSDNGSPTSTSITVPPVTGPTDEQLATIDAVLAAVFPDAPYDTEPGPSNTLAYYGFGEGGDRRATPQAILAANGGEAASDGVLITNLSAGVLVESPFEVAGRGRGFEATLDVRAVTPTGEILASTFTMGGPFEALEPFSTFVDTGPYDGPLYVVVASSTGLETALTDFALVRVHVRPGEGGTPVFDETAAVVRVEADDVLNIRTDPDASSPIIGELAPDATGVTILSRPEGLTGWWLVEAPDGTVGWASASFMVIERDFGPAEEALLLALADDFTDALVPFDAAAVAALPWSTRFGTVWMGWPGATLQRISARQLRDGSTDVWTSPRRWTISPQFDPAFEEVTLVEFLRLLDIFDTDRSLAIDRPHLYGGLDTPVVRNLHHVAIADNAIEEGFWRIVRVHVDFSTGDPEIAAVTVEHWDP